MKEILIKYRWIIFLALAFTAGFLLLWFFHPSTINLRKEVKKQKTIIEQQHKTHLADSTALTRRDDTIRKIISFYEKKIQEKEKQLSEIPVRYIKERERIQRLDPIARIQYFGDRTCGAELILLDKDSLAAVPLGSIDNAINLFLERDEFKETASIQKQILHYADSLNQAKDTLLKNKDVRIMKLTQDYYDSRKNMQDLIGIINQQKKTIRKKNIITGVTIGTTAIGLAGFIYMIAK